MKRTIYILLKCAQCGSPTEQEELKYKMFVHYIVDFPKSIIGQNLQKQQMMMESGSTSLGFSPRFLICLRSALMSPDPNPPAARCQGNDQV